MTSLKERHAMQQLLVAVAARSGAPSTPAQEIDVALAGKVEGMAIAADKRARRGG
jgi:hypothetical protein